MSNELIEFVINMRRQGHTMQMVSQYDEQGNLVSQTLNPCVLTCKACERTDAASDKTLVHR